MGSENNLSLHTCAAGLRTGCARSATTELALPKLLRGYFSISLTLALMHKDAQLATNLGTDSRTPIVVRELFQTVVYEHIAADKGAQTFVKLFESNAGAPIAPHG